MALGLLGGMLQGGGEAVQQNAQTRIKKRHDEAMRKLEQEFQTSEREASQQYGTQERVAGQEFTQGANQRTREFQAEQGGLDRAQNMTLAQMREQGANSRAAMGRNDWNVMQSSDGGLLRVNSRTGDIQPMDAPEGVSFGGGGWSDRDQAYIESLQAEMDSLQEIGKTGMLSDEQQSRMQEIPQEMRTYAQGIDADAEVLGTYGGMRGDSPQDAPPSSIAKPDQSGSREPAQTEPSQDAQSVLSQQQSEAETRAAAKEAAKTARRLKSEASTVARGLEGLGSPNIPGMAGSPDAWTQNRQRNLAKGKEKLAELMTAFNATEDEDLRDVLMEGMEVLTKAGVPLPQQ